MARKAPYYPWYPLDFKGSLKVKVMTLEEKGFYHDVLDHCWLYGSAPADPDELARLLGEDRRTSRRILPKISKCFLQTGEVLISERLEQEREKLNNKSEKARNSILKRWHKNDTNVIRTNYHSDSDSDSDKKEKKSTKEKTPPSASCEPAALRIYETYKKLVRTGARADALKSIRRLLEFSGRSEDELLACIQNYVKTPRFPAEDRYRIQANNFFGKDSRYEEFLPGQVESVPVKKKTDAELLREVYGDDA